MRRVLVTTAFALPLVAADLISKALVPTEAWAYHERSPAWAGLCVVVLAGLVGVSRIPALLVPPAAGLLAAGVTGNVVSAAAHGLRVPNPLVVEHGATSVAFNLADVWAVLGIVSLVVVLAVWLIRNRALLPGRRPAAATERDPLAEDGSTVF